MSRGAASNVTARAFARFYAPLAATSLLLTGTDPILMAVLARTASPTQTVAGYGVAFAVCGVLYAPMLAMQQLAAARLLNGAALAPVKRFAWAAGGTLSLIGATVAFTSAGDLVFDRWVGVRPEVLAEAVRAMQFLWPVPFLTAVRATHQGRLVAGHRTKPIGYATGARTGVLALVALALASAGGGAWLGAAAFTAGLVVETLVVTFSSAPGAKGAPGGPGAVASDGGIEGKDAGLGRFSAPLMANVLLWWATPLIINAVLARTPGPDAALAAFTIVQAVGWFVASPVGQLQHASIALVECPASHSRVRFWGGLLAVSMAGLLLLLAAAREPFLRALFALDDSLLALAGPALAMAAAYPLLYAWRQYYQGLFVRAESTLVVGVGALGRVACILLAAPALRALDVQGAVLGVGLNVLGLAAECLFLACLSARKVMPGLEARAAAFEPEASEA